MKKTLKKYLRNKSVIIGGTIVLVVIFSALFAPFITSHDAYEMNMSERLQEPSDENLLGTDQFGRDLLTRIIYGSRVSIKVGVISVGIAVVIGVFLGLVSGYYGGIIDKVIMRLVDVFLSFPVILLAIALVAALGPSTGSVMIALGLVYWTRYTRLVRSSVLSIKEEEYVLAAITIGASNMRIIFKYILPNAMAPIIVMATLGLGTAIIAESALSFLGLGIQYLDLIY